MTTIWNRLLAWWSARRQGASLDPAILEPSRAANARAARPTRAESGNAALALVQEPPPDELAEELRPVAAAAGDWRGDFAQLCLDKAGRSVDDALRELECLRVDLAAVVDPDRIKATRCPRSDRAAPARAP